MSEKKGLFSGLLGGKKQSKPCCNIEIVEESECDCGGVCEAEKAKNRKADAQENSAH